MSQVQRGEESVGCASSGMVGVEKAAKLFLQAGQSGMSKEEETGFGAVVKRTGLGRKVGQKQ